MVFMQPIYKRDRYHTQIGTVFYYYIKDDHEMFDSQPTACMIDIIDGEIKYASGTMIEPHNIHNITDNIDENNWETVKKVLGIFKNADFEKFKILYGILDKNSVGHTIAESIIDENTKTIEESVLTKKIQFKK